MGMCLASGQPDRLGGRQVELLSVWTPWRRLADHGERATLVGLAQGALARRRAAADWNVRTERAWCYLQPAGCVLPDQGWKLHLSATVTSADPVLERALGVLLPQRALSSSPGRTRWSRRSPPAGTSARAPASS